MAYAHKFSVRKSKVMRLGRIKKETEEKGKRNMVSLAICLGH